MTADLTCSCYFGLLSSRVSVLFSLVHFAPSTNSLSSVPHRRQEQFCLLWCFWHPTRGDRGGCEGCRWDFHGDRSIRRRYKQHNPSLWSGAYVWTNRNRNSTYGASSAEERLLKALWWQWWFLYGCSPDVQTWGCTVTTSSEPSRAAGVRTKNGESFGWNSGVTELFSPGDNAAV